MHHLVVAFVALEVPVLFIFAASVIFLRRQRPEGWLPRLLAFEFPLVALGGVGLPLWAAFTVLAAR